MTKLHNIVAILVVVMAIYFGVSVAAAAKPVAAIGAISAEA